MGASQIFFRRLLRLPGWLARQPREHWLVRRATQRLAAAAGRPVTPKLVVLVSEGVGTRVCKLGFGLKSAGWRTVLLHRRDLPANPAKSFDETHRFATPAEALVLAAEFRPVVYHVFANWNFNVATLFVRHKPGRIVLDNYDVLAGTLHETIEPSFRREIRLERICLEGADALCCRDLGLQCAKRAGYRLRGPRILIPDCCWGEPPGARPPRAEPADGFHVVNCGNVPINTAREYAVHCRELAALAVRLRAQGLVASGVHFHAYATFAAWKGAPRAGACAGPAGEVTATLHLHDRVPPDQLQRELMRYDAGLYHVGIGDDPPTYNRWKFVYTSGNRVFDYLDAEIPVLIHGSTFMEFLMKRIGADIRIEAPLHDAARRFLSREDVATLQRHAAAGRERLAVARCAPRLVALYESL